MGKYGTMIKKDPVTLDVIEEMAEVYFENIEMIPHPDVVIKNSGGTYELRTWEYRDE